MSAAEWISSVSGIFCCLYFYNVLSLLSQSDLGCNVQVVAQMLPGGDSFWVTGKASWWNAARILKAPEAEVCSQLMSPSSVSTKCLHNICVRVLQRA